MRLIMGGGGKERFNTNEGAYFMGCFERAVNKCPRPKLIFEILN
jgi:hypothetical protein